MKPIQIISKLNEAEYIKDRVKPSNEYNNKYDKVLKSLCNAYNALYDWGSASDCAESINSAYVDMDKIDPNATLTKRLAKLDKYLDEHWDDFTMDIDYVGDKLPDLIDIAEKLASKESGTTKDIMGYVQEQIKKVCKEYGVKVKFWVTRKPAESREISMEFQNLFDSNGEAQYYIFYPYGNVSYGKVCKALLTDSSYESVVEGSNEKVLKKLLSLIERDAKKQLKNNKKGTKKEDKLQEESTNSNVIDNFYYNEGLNIAKSTCENNKTLKCCKQVCEAVEEASGGTGECKTISIAAFKQGKPYPYMNHYVLSVIGNDGKNYIVDYTSKQFEGSVSPEDCSVSVATPHNGVWYEGEMSPKYNTVSEQINNFRNGNASGPVVIYTNIGIDQLS